VTIHKPGNSTPKHILFDFMDSPFRLSQTVFSIDGFTRGQTPKARPSRFQCEAHDSIGQGLGPHAPLALFHNANKTRGKRGSFVKTTQRAQCVHPTPTFFHTTLFFAEVEHTHEH
jgi:hypothetical protein